MSQAQASAAVSTMVAPAATYSSSVIMLPRPAPFWTSTWWPASARACTPAGVMPTRNSFTFISVGSPTFIPALLFFQVSPAALACEMTLPCCQTYCRKAQSFSGRYCTYTTFLFLVSTAWQAICHNFICTCAAVRAFRAKLFECTARFLSFCRPCQPEKSACKSAFLPFLPMPAGVPETPF